MIYEERGGKREGREVSYLAWRNDSWSISFNQLASVSVPFNFSGASTDPARVIATFRSSPSRAAPLWFRARYQPSFSRLTSTRSRDARRSPLSIGLTLALKSFLLTAGIDYVGRRCYPDEARIRISRSLVRTPLRRAETTVTERPSSYKVHVQYTE